VNVFVVSLVSIALRIVKERGVGVRRQFALDNLWEHFRESKFEKDVVAGFGPARRLDMTRSHTIMFVYAGKYEVGGPGYTEQPSRSDLAQGNVIGFRRPRDERALAERSWPTRVGPPEVPQARAPVHLDLNKDVGKEVA
jgi:hypothetical protein